MADHPKVMVFKSKKTGSDVIEQSKASNAGIDDFMSNMANLVAGKKAILSEFEAIRADKNAENEALRGFITEQGKAILAALPKQGKDNSGAVIKAVIDGQTSMLAAFVAASAGNDANMGKLLDKLEVMIQAQAQKPTAKKKAKRTVEAVPDRDLSNMVTKWTITES